MMADAPLPATGGVIRDVAVLDLTASTSPEDLSHIQRIEDVAVILVRESAAPALTRVDLQDVANVVQVPEGRRARVHTGTLTLTGEALSEESARDDILVVTGALVVTSPVPSVAFAGIVVTGSVLAPEGSEATLGMALTRLTGAFTVYPYREGQRVVLRSGSIELRGSALANSGGTPDDILLVTGTLTVRGPVAEVGYARIVIAGSLIAPQDAEEALEQIVVSGTTIWYTAPPKSFAGSITLGRAFFQLLEEPITLILAGSTQIEPDVTLDDVRPNIAAVYAAGSVRAPRDVLGLFQVRGTISGSAHPNDAD